MQKKYSNDREATLCDNVSCRGSGISLTPQCIDNKATHHVTVYYNPPVNFSSDTFDLCEQCLKALKKDSRRLGHKVVSKRMST